MLDTVFARDEEVERQRLANQGIPEGSEAYREAMDDFSRRKSSAYEQASAAPGMPIDMNANYAQNQAQRNVGYQGELNAYNNKIGTQNTLISGSAAIAAAFF
jgi:hypothetical protein